MKDGEEVWAALAGFVLVKLMRARYWEADPAQPFVSLEKDLVLCLFSVRFCYKFESTFYGS